MPADGGPAAAAVLDFHEGDRISDRYVIEKAIGQGGMGSVYRALDTLIHEQVALKFMKPELVRTKKGQELFLREAQVARRLRHENVVAVHDAGLTQENILYISMEFLEGQSLRGLLLQHRKKGKPVPVRLAVALISQVLAALEYAHRTVVHRDIKPENVMLLPGERVKVLDFGLAKAIHAEQEEPQEAQKKPKKVIGTLAYASPEQVRRQPIDHRADLFAVGLILRELLTLRTPMDEPVGIMQVRHDVSPSLIKVLDKALEKDKDLRWQSAGEFRRHLSGAFKTSYAPVVSPGPPEARKVSVSTEGMVFLEGGSFLMGTDDVFEEGPRFEAFVEPFYIDIAPVTVAQYAEYLEAVKAAPPKFWNHVEFSGATQPVVGLNWNEANAYAAWAGKRLPSEAEWEFAARGRENRKYPWGQVEPDATRCNFGDYLGMPSIVTMHEEGMTAEGIKDMAGNVFEWTIEPFVPYAKRGDQEAATTPLRVVRGGSWHSPPHELRCTYRKGLFTEAQLTTVGFRCVLSAKPACKS